MVFHTVKPHTHEDLMVILPRETWSVAHFTLHLYLLQSFTDLYIFSANQNFQFNIIRPCSSQRLRYEGMVERVKTFPAKVVYGGKIVFFSTKIVLAT